MIQPDKTYHILYTPTSFARNNPLLLKIRDLYNLEIPYLDYPELTVDFQDALDMYVYLEDKEGAQVAIRRLCKQHVSINFMALGKIKGAEILNLINTCLGQLERSVTPGKTYKVLQGPYKNLHVVVDSIKGEDAKTFYDVLNERKKFTFPVTSLEEVRPLDPMQGFRDFLSEAQRNGKYGAVLIDGSFSLHRAMFGYDMIYTKDNRFIGGAQGFYFDILRFKELYPDREIHVVFDAYRKLKFRTTPGCRLDNQTYPKKWISAYKDNFNWCERLVKSLGYHYYKILGIGGDDVIGSLTRHLLDDLGYQDILIYSSDRDFFSIVDDQVSVILPKKSFRGNSKIITPKQAREEFKVNDTRKISWVRALSGDANILSVNRFYEKRGQETKYTISQYLPYINESMSMETCKEKLLSDNRFSAFVSSGQWNKNLKSMILRTDIFESADDLSEWKSEYDKGTFLDLLEECGFYRELEGIGRTERILQSNW